jgi:hypothetical protein
MKRRITRYVLHYSPAQLGYSRCIAPIFSPHTYLSPTPTFPLSHSTLSTFYLLQRYKICPGHAKATQVILDGAAVRFCQQCGRFHPLDSFEGNKRTCKAKLKVHNARRRHNKKARDNSNGTTDESYSSASLNTESPDRNMNNSNYNNSNANYNSIPLSSFTHTTAAAATALPLHQRQAMPVNHHLAPLPTHTSYGPDYFFTNETVTNPDDGLFISGGGDLITTMHPPPSSHDHRHTHNDANDDLIWEGANIFADDDDDIGDGIGGSLLVHPVPTYLSNTHRGNGSWEGGGVDDDIAAGFVDAVLNNNDNSSSHLSLPGLLPMNQELILPNVLDSGGDYVFDNNNKDNYNNSNKGSRKYMAVSDDGITVGATTTTTNNNNNNNKTVVTDQREEGLTLERVGMKLFNAHPDDLPPEIQKELRQLLNITTGASNAFALSIRPGCVQITMDALLTKREKDVMKAKGVGELAQVALNHVLSAVPALSSPATPAAAGVTPRSEGDDEVDISISTPLDKDHRNNIPLINGKHPDLMFCYGNEMAYVNRDDGVISTSTTTNGTTTGLPPLSSSPTTTTIIPHAPLLEAVQPLAMTPEAAAITNLVLYGKNITGTHDAVFIRSRGRSVNLSVMAVIPPNHDHHDRNRNGSTPTGSQQSEAYVSDRERVVVEILAPAQGLHRVEVQRGAVLSQPVSFLVLDDAEAVREIQQLETCSTVTPSQVQAFVSEVGVVMDFIARAGVLRCVTEEEERRAVLLARRLFVLSVNRGWKAMVRMLMPLALLPVGIPVSPNATVTTAIDGVMAELDGCARALGAIPLLHPSFSSSESESVSLPNGEGSGRHQAQYFEEALRKAVSTSFLHVVAASPCPEIAELLDTWARRISYPWTIKTTTRPGDDVEGKGQEQQQHQLSLTPLHLTCLLNDQAAMAAALTTMIEASTGGDDNNSHSGYKLWFKLKDGKRRTAAQFAKLVGNDGVLQWLNKERDCRGLLTSDIEKEIAEEEIMMKNKKSSREGSQEQMGVGTAAAGGSSTKQVSSLNADKEEGEEEEDMLVAAGSQKKKPAVPPSPPPPPFTFWKNKCSKERTADIENDVRTAQIIEDARAAAHGGGAAAARMRREHDKNGVPVLQQVAVLGIIAFATMALKILSSS